MKVSLYNHQNKNISLTRPASVYLSDVGQLSFGANPILKSAVSDLKQFTMQRTGKYYCGPVSAANGIITLARNGFQNLFKFDNPLILVEELASHLKTDPNGTIMNNYCSGLESFVHSKGYQCKLNYQGFRDVDSKYKTANIPDLTWVKDEIANNKVVFVNMGIYKKKVQGAKPVFQRQYGHFLVSTGSGSNGVGFDPSCLTMYDSSSKLHGAQYQKVKKITEGTFIHNQDDNEISLVGDAKGFHEIAPGFDYFSKGEMGIINGVLSLHIEK